MKCPNCNQEVSDDLNNCTYCGEELIHQEVVETSENDYFPGKYKKDYQAYQNPYENNTEAQSSERLNYMFMIPGIVMPLLGVGVYFFIRKNKPRNAQIAIKGAFIGMFLNILLMYFQFK